MMRPKLIKTEIEYEDALSRIDEIMNASPGTAEGDELELLAFLVEAYEAKNYPIDEPDPVDAIKFRMEQLCLKQSDLSSFMGGKSKVSEVFNGKRALSLSMIRKLHKGLGIPADVLIKEGSFSSGFSRKQTVL